MKQAVRSWRARTFLLAFGIAAALLAPSPVQTAITPIGAALIHSGTATVWDPESAYNPINQVVLVVFNANDQGPWGQFLDINGNPIGGQFLIVNGVNGQFPKVAARTTANGGFMVTYWANGGKYAAFVLPGSPTQLSGPVLIDAADLERESSGMAYAADYDAFIVTYPKQFATYIAGVRPTLQVLPGFKTTVLTGECSGAEVLNKPEFAYDPIAHRGLVAGWRDASECGGSNGGIWTRLISFDGTNFGNLNLGEQWLSKGSYDEDLRVAFNPVTTSFVVAWSRLGGSTRSILRGRVDVNGNVTTAATILPPNLTNASPGDDAFNQVALAYNTTTNRFLVAMRGNDSGGSPKAPAYSLELDANGDAVPGTLAEFLPHSPAGVDGPSRPFPSVIPIPGTNQFLIVVKAGTTNREELDMWSARVAADGATGSGWPTSASSGGGGGGGSTPPPPPPPSTKTLTIVRPTGGTILGKDIYCGDGGALCSKAFATGALVELVAIPSSGSVTFSGYTGGCSASFTIAADMTCTATFTSSSGSGGGGGGGSTPPPPPPPGNGTLVITKPTGGTITGPAINCGDGGSACQVSFPNGMPIQLGIAASSGFSFGGWVGCSGGFAIVSGTVTCGATFNAVAGSGGSGGSGGTGGSGASGASGSGTPMLVITKPTGGTITGPAIFCGDLGSQCQVALPNGMTIGLDVIVSPGSSFTGWVGCPNGVIAINGTTTCGATFSGSSSGSGGSGGSGGLNQLNIVNPGTGGGGGVVVADGIACTPGNGGVCSMTVATPKAIVLTPAPFPGFVFGGWVGTGCSNVMTISGTFTCTANFNRVQ